MGTAKAFQLGEKFRQPGQAGVDLSLFPIIKHSHGSSSVLCHGFFYLVQHSNALRGNVDVDLAAVDRIVDPLYKPLIFQIIDQAGKLLLGNHHLLSQL